MGKSTASSMLQRMRIPIYDSDSSVHKVLSEKGEAVRQVGAVFPEVISNGSVDREALGKLVFKDRKALGVLESIIHPIIRNIQDNFLRCAAANRKRIVVLDIPLLFEVGLDTRCDATIVVSAPDFIQEARVMSRPGMTAEKFKGIRERQMSNNEKCKRATFIVPSNRGLGETHKRLRVILELMKRECPNRWPPDHFLEQSVMKRRRNARNCFRY